jgi:hypothetical protein
MDGVKKGGRDSERLCKEYDREKEAGRERNNT